MTSFTKEQVNRLLEWTEETIALIEKTLNANLTQTSCAEDEKIARAIFEALYAADALAFPEITGGQA